MAIATELISTEDIERNLRLSTGEEDVDTLARLQSTATTYIEDLIGFHIIAKTLQKRYRLPYRSNETLYVPIAYASTATIRHIPELSDYDATDGTTYSEQSAVIIPGQNDNYGGTILNPPSGGWNTYSSSLLNGIYIFDVGVDDADIKSTWKEAALIAAKAFYDDRTGIDYQFSGRAIDQLIQADKIYETDMTRENYIRVNYGYGYY